ncbi:MAG: S-layer homology domain-containing protein [Candidatus Gracilibacteria bacterium]
MRFLRSFLAMVIVVSFPLTALAGTFSDVSSTNENREAIEYLVYNGTLKGYDDSTFRPSNTINRAELMKVLVLSQGIEPDATVYKNCFPDVTTEWFAPYVCYAHEQGWVDGYPDNTFLPANTVNKVEAAKMVINAWGYSDMLPDSLSISKSDLFDDTYPSVWYAPYVYLIKSWNLEGEWHIDGSAGNFNPADGMERGRAAEYMFRIIVMEDFGEAAYGEGDGLAFFTAHGLDYLLEDSVADPVADPVVDPVVDPVADPVVDEEVYLDLTSSSVDQVLIITNQGDYTVNLEGYSLETDATFYEFGSYELGSWESVEVEYYFPEETVYLRSPEGGIVDYDYNF